MFVAKGNNFQYLLSKPCFSHNLLSLLKNRKSILACADTHVSCDSSQLGGVHNLTLFTMSFAIRTLCEGMKTPVHQMLP